MSKAPVTARREPSSPGHYSWVWVIPLTDGRYRVRAFEVPHALVDEDRSFYDEDMLIVHDEILESLDEIDDSVSRTGVDPEDLDAPWKNDFPL